MRSALDTVEKVHPILEPARHGCRIARREDKAPHGQYAPHRIATREEQGVGPEAEKIAQLLAVGTAEEPSPPEREHDHARERSGSAPRPAAACASASR